MKAGDLTAWVHGNSHQRKGVGRNIGDALHAQNIKKKILHQAIVGFTVSCCMQPGISKIHPLFTHHPSTDD